MREAGLVCAHCARQTLHKQETPNQVFHLLIVLFSCGLWLIPWLIANSNSTKNPWICGTCGTPWKAPIKVVSPQERRAIEERNRRAGRATNIAFGIICGVIALVVAGLIIAAEIEKRRTSRLQDAWRQNHPEKTLGQAAMLFATERDLIACLDRSDPKYIGVLSCEGMHPVDTGTRLRVTSRSGRAANVTILKGDGSGIEELGWIDARVPGLE